MSKKYRSADEILKQAQTPFRQYKEGEAEAEIKKILEEGRPVMVIHKAKKKDKRR